MGSAGSLTVYTQRKVYQLPACPEYAKVSCCIVSPAPRTSLPGRRGPVRRSTVRARSALHTHSCSRSIGTEVKSGMDPKRL